MAKVLPLDHPRFREWIATRPDRIRGIVERRPPDTLYRVRTTGERATIYSYDDDGTITVDIFGKYNLIPFERQIVGVAPDDLEECDLPAADELVGVMLCDGEVKRYYAELERERLESR